MRRGGDICGDGALCEERVVYNLVQARAELWIGGENLGDEVLGVGRDGTLGGEVVHVVADALVDGLDVCGLEWGAANDEGVEDDADGPGVNFKGVAVGGVEEDLRSNVVGGAAYGLLALSWVFDEGGEAKVAHFEVHGGVEEEVTEFEIAVDNLVSVHVVACTGKLDDVEAGFGFSEAAATAQEVHERTAGAEFESHVDVFLVVEAVLEAHDVRVFEGAMNFDFCVQLEKGNKYVMFERKRGCWLSPWFSLFCS